MVTASYTGTVCLSFLGLVVGLAKVLFFRCVNMVGGIFCWPSHKGTAGIQAIVARGSATIEDGHVAWK